MYIARPSLLRAVGHAQSIRALPLSRVVAVHACAAAQRRSITIESVTPKDSIAILNKQRQLRPESPHLEIYQPQLTWYLSGLHRITGVAVAGGLYAASLLYLLHPIYPAIDSAHLIQFVADLPVWLKTAAKVAVALPLTFHSFNGLRHLMWDVGKGLTIKAVYATGYSVLAATAISTLYLAFFV